MQYSGQPDRVCLTHHLVEKSLKRYQLLSLMLTVCLVFSTSASAFLTYSMHQHDETQSTYQHEAHQNINHSYDNESDHAHHCHVHQVGDIVEFESLSLTRTASTVGCDYSSQLVSRNYSPLLPPPNA